MRGRGIVNILAGTTIFTRDETYNGNTTISGGTLQLGNGNASGSINSNNINSGLISENITDNGTVAFDRSDFYTYSAVISGSGNLYPDRFNGTWCF